MPARTESGCRSDSCRQCRQPSRSTRTRSPTAGVHRQRTNHSACQNTPKNRTRSGVTIFRETVCCVSLQAQYQAFVRFAVRAAQLGLLRSIGPAFWNLYSGRLSLRELWSTPVHLRVRCRGRNVVAPGEYSKGFFHVPIGLYRGIFRPATALGMPARSALGPPAGVNPSAVIKSWIWPLWPSPASTTRAARGARRQAACGLSTR
jgi:hypothetical protein